MYFNVLNEFNVLYTSVYMNYMNNINLHYSFTTPTKTESDQFEKSVYHLTMPEMSDITVN